MKQNRFNKILVLNMKNKHLQNKTSLRLALLALLLSMVGMTNAFAANHDFTSVAPNGQTLYYKITSNTTDSRTVMVTHPYIGQNYFIYPYSGGTKPTGDLIIPYFVEYNGISYSVTALDELAFKSCNSLTSVVIPASVQTIGRYSFAECTGLTAVTISTSVTSISTDVFNGCSNLVTVNFNATNCSSVGSNTWSGCTKFTTLNLGNTVIRTPDYGFQGANKITVVTLPNNLTTIGDYCFDGCTDLASVTCGNASNLDAVGNYAFQNCSSLASINLPNTLNSIGNGAFSGCSQLMSTTDKQLLPNALTSIGDYAFQNASTMAYIRIPSTLTSLGKDAFKNCTSLNTVDYEASNCTFSGTQAEPPFFGCSGLTTINVSDNVTQIPDYCFKDCYALTNLTLRNGLTSIGTYGFYECRNINTLVLPVSVTAIGSYAFGNAYDMQIARVESHNPTPPTIGGEVAFASGQTIYVPSASVNAYQAADYWSDYTIMGMSQHYDFYQTCSSGQTLYYIIEDAAARRVKVTYAKHYNGYYYQGHPEPAGGVVIPASVTYNNQNYAVTSIDECAFKDCVRMTAVTLPASISCIEENAFAGCSGLTTVNYNATQCLTMGSSDAPVFADCPMLTTLNIGTGVNTLPAYAFKNCSHLNCNLVFPNSLLTIGEEAFYGCSGMISQLNFPNAVTTIGDKAFYQCSSLIGNLRLGTAVTSVGEQAFRGCAGLTTLTMYDALEQIGASAFCECTGLSGTVTIPNGVVELGDAAFKDCTAITGLALGTALESIGNNAFENCTGLTVPIILPSSVTHVGANAFMASGITSVTIPNSVTSMQTGAFMNCTGLTQISIRNKILAASEFEGCTALTAVTIPASVTAMLENAFKDCTGLTSIILQNHLIGESAFEGCTGLNVLDIPNCIQTIENNAFYGCTGLTAVSVPYTVTNMGNSVFENCTLLNNVTLGNMVIAASQFKGCSGLEAFTVPAQINSIGENAFVDCSNLTVFNYNAENCTIMGSSENPIFGGTTAITEFHIGASVNTIANYAFKNCGSVVEIHAAPANAPQFTGYDTQYGFADILQSIPVYVPCGRSSYYQNATYWNHFSNYIEDYPYSVIVSTNNAMMGSAMVTQEPSCDNNGQTVVTATPSQNYFFVNWTLGGNIVSTNPSYSFTPTDNVLLVANFADSQIEVNVTSDPEEGGYVTGGGMFDFGALVTLTAMANNNFTFVNWTENGNVVSTNSTYSFTASIDRNLVAHFVEFANYWVPNDSSFEDNMTLTCVLQLDGEEQSTTMFEVGAFCGTDCRGSQRPTYFAPANRYIIQMTVFGETNDVITFRLYDHELGQEVLLTPPASISFTTNGYGSLTNPYILNFTSTVSISAEANPADGGTITGAGNFVVGAEATLTANANTGYQFASWTLNGEVVSTSASYQFTVTETAHYIANFNYVHSQALVNGWNWWSTYVELNNNNGLSQLENSIGNAGIIIKSRTNGFVEPYQDNGVTNWYGTLGSICNEQMYKIRMNAAGNAVVVGELATPSNHPVIIKNGWNWIGFPSSTQVSVDVAMAGFNPEPNDVLKGRNSYTTYYSENGTTMWYGTLNKLEPGKGYMYRSNSTNQKTLTFNISREMTEVENITGENNVFQFNDSNFADNMTITAVLDLSGKEVRSENYEVAAFVGNECRGSVKLMYVEPVNRYMAFLTVFGTSSEQLRFFLTDGIQTDFSMNEMSFVSDGTFGSLTDPVILSFGTTAVNENEMSKVTVYPNPSQGQISIQGSNIQRVDVVNVMGQIIYSEIVENDVANLDLSSCANGIYLLRVVTTNVIINKQWIKR